jgi:ComF family protein
MVALLSRASRLALDLLFPPQCAICHAGGSALCELCMARLPLAEQPRCQRCWDDVRSGLRCERCATAPPRFASVRSPFTHADAARDLVHLLKYDGLTSLADPMAGLMVEAARGFVADVIVPVPLHGGRQRSRGYNQAALLASRIASETGRVLDRRAVRRVRATKPLARSMSRDERAAIVAGAFRADEARVSGRAILLVDDVVTTGATLDSCAGALLEAGARRVDAVTFVHA